MIEEALQRVAIAKAQRRAGLMAEDFALVAGGDRGDGDGAVDRLAALIGELGLRRGGGAGARSPVPATSTRARSGGSAPCPPTTSGTCCATCRARSLGWGSARRRWPGISSSCSRRAAALRARAWGTRRRWHAW